MRIMHLLAMMICASIGAIIFFAYQHELILIQPYNWQQSGYALQQEMITYDVWLKHTTTWKHETERCIKPNNTHEFVYHLAQRWLHYAYREGVIDKKIHVQAVMLTHNDSCVYISFDRNPCNDDSSTYQRIELMQGLLKTIAQEPSIHYVHLLVNHMAIHDPYINLTIAWPVAGAYDTCNFT